MFCRVITWYHPPSLLVHLTFPPHSDGSPLVHFDWRTDYPAGMSANSSKTDACSSKVWSCRPPRRHRRRTDACSRRSSTALGHNYSRLVGRRKSDHETTIAVACAAAAADDSAAGNKSPAPGFALEHSALLCFSTLLLAISAQGVRPPLC